MKQFFHRALKFFAYTLATIVILLAIAVGLFRLLLPRLPEYQDDIKRWTSAAIGMQVEFSGMDARWGLSGPELEFYDAELIRADDGMRIIVAEEVRVGVGFVRFLFDRALIVDRLVIRETSVEIRRLADDSVHIQGVPAEELLKNFSGSSAPSVAIEIVGEDIELQFMQAEDERPRVFDISNIVVSVDEKRIAADADVRLPDDLGRQLNASATQLFTMPAGDRAWDLVVEADDINLPGWSDMVTGELDFVSGAGDLELAVSIGPQGVSNATAEIDLSGVALRNETPFDIVGRVEFDVSNSGWLVAANEFAISFADHEWPVSSLRVEASVDAGGEVVMLDARASYLMLDDLTMLEPWLGNAQRNTLIEYAPKGVVRDLVATVSDIGSERPRFNVTADLYNVGFRDTGKRRGVAGFTGLVRANRAGGLLEIRSRDLQIIAPDFVADTINIESVDGTIVWRNSNNQTTILSDSIAIESEFFDSNSNVQLVFNADSGSPLIDLASSWSISDVAQAKRLIPRKGLNPQLYDWFQTALVSGSIPSGTTSLNGPLDKFPFDGGEGRLLIEASVRNMVLKYHRDWPAAEQADVEVVIDNARLYSVKNNSMNTGNRVVDANVEIPNLRVPILTIDSFSTGTLASIHAFSKQSPIGGLFDGQLDRITVTGDAAFSLNLTAPLKKGELQDFEFVTRIRSNNGTFEIEGFDAPITDLIGEVTIDREHISSAGIGATFLGEEVSISLQRSDDARFSVIATADGTITDEGIVSGLGLPLEGLVSGAAEYRARILFPNGAADTPSPLTIEVESELQGLVFDIPSPAEKAAQDALPLLGDIRFMPGGEGIESAGTAGDRLTWRLAFNKPEGSWDFDRGVITLGGESAELAETRGLHIRGSVDQVRLQDWLDLSRSGEDKVGAADRIRSIDVLVDDLYLVGQHLRVHRVQVDRSARDWLVQFDGEDIVGSVFVPYNFSGDRAMVMDMQRLHLPGGEESDPPAVSVDPRKLPPIQLTATDFAFGDRYFGAVEAVLEKTPDGLKAVSLSSKDSSYEISGNGRWEVDANDPLGSHSTISAVLNSTNVKETMARLNYQPGIVSDELRIVFDLDWSGSPRADFLNVLNGDVQVRFGNGQLEEVDPGAGRVFGLMSITALPRRLSFDFRDVFNKGFGFDKISGNFKINNGVTLTCDLSLDGPAADIGIVGAVDLGQRTYDQTAAVSANVGNTLPIVGAVVAGPQVAAALLIFSQIFKKPLREVGQVYYGITGSWDEPDVESAKAEAFVASGQLAGCLADGE